MQFYDGTRPDLFRNVLLAAGLAASSFATAGAVKKLWNSYKKWKPKKKKLKKKVKKLKKKVKKRVRKKKKEKVIPPQTAPPPGPKPTPGPTWQWLKRKAQKYGFVGKQRKVKKRPKPRPTPTPTPPPAKKPAKPKPRAKIPMRRRAQARKVSGGRRAGGGKEDSLLKLFKRLDVDTSGKLSARELGPLARRFKIQPKKLLGIMDTSGDNQISWPEFARYMRKKIRSQ